MIYKGSVWVFGDNIDTDVIIPARYLNTTEPRELAYHCMEDVNPGFLQKLKSVILSLQVVTLVAEVPENMLL